MTKSPERVASATGRNAEGQFVRHGCVMLLIVLACSLPALCATLWRTEPEMSVELRRTVRLSGALPQLARASLLPGGSFAVFSERFTENFVSVGIFSTSGELVKNLAGTDVPTGLASLSSLQIDSGGILWATTFIPGEVARLNQNGLISVSDLAKLKIAYDLALDEPHGYVYVSGCASENSRADSPLLLVHQFAIDGLKYRKSFLQTDPSVVGNTQLGIQSVPLDVDAKGTVWAVDSPAFTLYSIDPTSGRSTSIPIRSRVAKPSGKLDPFGDNSYTRKYIYASFTPDSVVVAGDRVIVAIRQPGDISAAAYLLEIFDSAGVQIGVDIPAPGRLVGKFGNGGLLFGSPGKNGPTLIEGALSDSRHTHGK
jgi:hypothetical protein